ncbi:hypothetical protein NN561_011858 [Cricetulus griseus]
MLRRGRAAGAAGSRPPRSRGAAGRSAGLRAAGRAGRETGRTTTASAERRAAEACACACALRPLEAGVGPQDRHYACALAPARRPGGEPSRMPALPVLSPAASPDRQVWKPF